MTLSAYLGLLSLGSAIQTRSSTGCQEEEEAEEEELDTLRRMTQSITLAEIDTVSTVSTHNAPSERRVEVRENISGVILAIGTMVANYSLCFPIVAARHRLQALPVLYSYQRDTPMYGISTIIYAYRNGGIRRLYPGFGLGLIGQTLSATYESGLNQILSPTWTSARKKNTFTYILSSILSKGLVLAINIPLYPLYRNALILRVQSESALTRIVIRSSHDFIQLYKQDLKDYLPPYKSNRNIISTFVPSCILNLITEKVLIFIYRHIFQKFSSNNNNTQSDQSSKKKKDSTVLHTFYPEIACGVISSIITRALSYPVDTVIFKLMVQDSGVLKVNTTYKGFFDCIKRTWCEEGGWKAFYPGWGIGILEIGMGYVILEASWWAYRCIEWKLTVPGSSDTRAVRKARRLRDRFKE
ncbi:mitochondrial carrier domain-containing protein [Thamnidium elegans]|uniref:Mitochondrial carrier n=1 Tax=Thamnidium elegans TaxID=101142 RepID=A0A8H7W2X4_9FUNG|nr:hypothetical protein INT48_000874 [Thamnidium elegans]KAI8064010.1 mitochondrial carrier domain-containing protein [Thamnidium elegans]